MIDKDIQEVLPNGPNRVVIGNGGYAVSSQVAREHYNIVPDVIFIRNDGWALGAPRQFARTAFVMWSDHWVGMIILPNTIVEEVTDENLERILG